MQICNAVVVAIILNTPAFHLNRVWRDYRVTILFTIGINKDLFGASELWHMLSTRLGTQF
jgi:hypothetical protein